MSDQTAPTLPGADTTRLEPRREPQQARSRERLERILDATGELLDEVGLDGLSTRLIAARAEVNVATIYQFFPNKYAVIKSLVERTADRLIERHRELTGAFDLGAPLSETNEKVLTGFAAAVLEIPGFFALRRAMHALPELADTRAIEERAKRAIADRIVERLFVRNPNLSPSQREVMARTMIEMTLTMLEQSTQVPPGQRAAVLRELRTLMVCYLAHYFGADSVPPARSAGPN